MSSFLDTKSAYDSADRSLLWPKCERMGWDGDLIRFLKSLFNHVKVMARVGGRQTREVDTGVGLLQGSILSPTLFNVYINDLPKTLRERHSRDHKYELAPSKCEVVPPVYRKDPHEAVKLYGTPLKEVHRYRYLGFPFGAVFSCRIIS